MVSRSAYEKRLKRPVDLSAHEGFVTRIAHNVMRSMAVPPCVEIDDLKQLGMIGLLDSYENFGEEQGTAFESFAYRRVRGEMIDHLRALNLKPRTLTDDIKKYNSLLSSFRNEHHRDPTRMEIADQLGVSAKKVEEILAGVGTPMMAIEDAPEVLDMHATDMLEDSIINAGLDIDYLESCIDNLPERIKLVLSLYYLEGLKMKDIAAIMSCSQAYVSQLRSEGISTLREMVISD